MNPSEARGVQAMVGDYAEQARANLGLVARQFQQSPARAAGLGPVHWEPDASWRWQRSSPAAGTVAGGGIDPTRPALIAHCLDQVASATGRISRSSAPARAPAVSCCSGGRRRP
jgi:hypothetical protein